MVAVEAEDWELCQGCHIWFREGAWQQCAVFEALTRGVCACEALASGGRACGRPHQVVWCMHTPMLVEW